MRSTYHCSPKVGASDVAHRGHLCFFPQHRAHVIARTSQAVVDSAPVAAHKKTCNPSQLYLDAPRNASTARATRNRPKNVIVASDILDARQLIEGLRRLLEEAPPKAPPAAQTPPQSTTTRTQLTNAIMLCRSVEQLAGIVGEHEHSLNAVHLSAVASKLSSLMASPSNPNRSTCPTTAATTTSSTASPGIPVAPAAEQQVPPYQRRRARRQQQQQQLDVAASVGRVVGCSEGGAAQSATTQLALPQLLQRLEKLVLERLDVSHPPATGMAGIRSSSSSSSSRSRDSNRNRSRTSDGPDVPTNADSRDSSSPLWQASSMASSAASPATDTRSGAAPFSSTPTSAQAAHTALLPPQSTLHVQQHHARTASPGVHSSWRQTSNLLPDKLGPRQLATAVHGLAKAGHRPSREWMSQVLEASQVLLQRHTRSMRQGGAEKGSEPDSISSSISSSGMKEQRNDAHRSNSTLSSSSQALLQQLAARRAQRSTQTRLRSPVATAPAHAHANGTRTNASTVSIARASQTTPSGSSNWSSWSNSSSGSSSSIRADNDSWGGKPLPQMGTRKSKFTGQELAMLAWGLAHMHQREQEEVKAAHRRRLQRVGQATAHNSQQQQQLLLREALLSQQHHSQQQQDQHHQQQHQEQVVSIHRSMILRRPVWPKSTHQFPQSTLEGLPAPNAQPVRSGMQQALNVDSTQADPAASQMWPGPTLDRTPAYHPGWHAHEPGYVPTWRARQMEGLQQGSSVEAESDGHVGSGGLPLPSPEWGQAFCAAVLAIAAPQHHQQHHQHHMHNSASSKEGVSSSSQYRGDTGLDSMATGNLASPSLSPSPLLGAAHSASSGCTPQDVSLITWAMAVLKVHPSAFFMAQWLQVCSSQMSMMSGMDAAQLAWALAKLQYRPPAAWMQTLAARAAQLAQQNQLKPRDTANLLWALAKLRFDPGAAVLDPLLSALPGDQHTTAAAYKPMDAANVLWALGVVQRKPAPAAMQMLLAAVCDGPSPLSQQELSNILWGLARLNYAPSLPTQRALIAQLHRLLSISIMGPSALAQLAWALPRLGLTVPHPVQQRLAAAMLAAAPRMNTQGLLLTLEWVLRCGVQLLPSQVDSLTNRVLAKLLEGLTRARMSARLASRRAELLVHKPTQQDQRQQHSAASPPTPQQSPASDPLQPEAGQVQLLVPPSTPYSAAQFLQHSSASEAQPSDPSNEPQPQMSNLPHAHLRSHTSTEDHRSNLLHAHPSHASTEDHHRPLPSHAHSSQPEKLSEEPAIQPSSDLPPLSFAPEGQQQGEQQCVDALQQQQLLLRSSFRHVDGAKLSDRPADPKAHVVAQLLWVTVKLGRPLPREQLDDLLHTSITVLQYMKPREVCAISWALAKMRHRPSTRWMRCLLHRARELQQAGVLSPKQQALLFKCLRPFRVWSNSAKVPASLRPGCHSLPPRI